MIKSCKELTIGSFISLQKASCNISFEQANILRCDSILNHFNVSDSHHESHELFGREESRMQHEAII